MPVSRLPHDMEYPEPAMSIWVREDLFHGR